MKKYTLLFLSLLVSVMMINAQKNVKLSLDPQKAEWFKEAKFGIFIHWGLYSMLEGSYNGHTLPAPELPQGKSWYAEWVQMRLEVPNAEYQALAKDFNPIHFDADAWIQEVKNGGAKYFVITAKHHDGFALWDSKVSQFTITNTPYKKDLIAQLVAACKKHDIKYGFYYSHWQDWEHPQGALPEWREQRTSEEFEKYWQEKSLPQVKELLTMFDPDLLWFDTWGTEDAHITPERRDELIALVRDNSDKCLINGRIAFNNPGENIDFLEMFDNHYPTEVQSRPWQTPATMTHSWGWHANDFNWKPSSRMLSYLVSNTSKGGNYLLNIGPKPDGTYPAPAIRRLREMGAWLDVNGEAVYGAKPSTIKIENGTVTEKEEGGRRYVYVTVQKVDEVTIPLKAHDISDCRILETNEPLEMKGDSHLMVTIPKIMREDNTPKVIRLRVK